MTLFSGIAQARASRAAGTEASNAALVSAQMQQAAAQESTAEQRRQYDTSRADMAPWLESGKGALATLDRTAAGDMSGFMTSPDYNFTRSEGNRDIGSSFAARGGAASGNALKALSEFNANLASRQFGDWWNRTATRAGVGQTAAGNLGALGANTAGNIANINTTTAGNVGNTIVGGGNARASGIRGAGDAYANSAQNAARIFSYFYGAGG